MSERLTGKELEERRRQVDLHFQKMIQVYGWAMHAVPASDGEHANYHTHGVAENFKHLDFQITLPIDPQVAHGVIACAIKNVEDGVTYMDDTYYDDIIKDNKVLMKKFTEQGRDVLRIILPDLAGRFPHEDECGEIYKTQQDDFEYVGTFEFKRETSESD